MHKLRFFLIYLIFLILISGCKTIKQKTDAIVEKENQRLTKFIGKSSSELQIKLGKPDESGRRKPEVREDSSFEVKADMVIKALGFDPEDLPTLFDSNELQVTKWGTIKTDFDTMETNLSGVFAAGDIVRGASLVVWAIKDGRDAAVSIKKYLEKNQLKRSKVA